MRTAKYTMDGRDGELFLAVNGFVLAYAEKFTAFLVEHLKEVSYRGSAWLMPTSYEAKIMLSRLTSRHDDAMRDALAKSDRLNFEFRGSYKAKNGFMYPVGFSRLVPINGDLDGFMGGYVDDWEFDITCLDEATIGEFKKAS